MHGIRSSPPPLGPMPAGLRGENSHRAKMTQADVDELREDRAHGATLDACFLKFHERCGISYNQVRKILRGEQWK